MIEFNKTTIRYTLAGILLVGVLITGLYFTSVRRGENTNVHQQETPKITTGTIQPTTQSTLSVTQKSTKSDPDLVVSNKYVAKIDGKLVEAPMKIQKEDSTAGSGTTAVVSTTIDVTPIVNKMTPRWEAGVGIGYVDKDVLPCMTLQRNYKHDKAIEAVIQIDTDGNFKGASVIHKWRF